MVVSGRELASLDFANLIGGPLNAVIEAQAKSALTTATFIKEVAFDKEGNAINVNFSYSRKGDDEKYRDFTLTVPFLTMLPVPYITIVDAVVEFNAKITSTNESKMDESLGVDVGVEAGVKSWFVTAKVTSKMSYQRKKATSEKEERTFDMHVRVEAKNEDMPAGTERLLTILENSIEESKKGGTFVKRIFTIKKVDKANAKSLTVDATDEDLDKLSALKFKACEKTSKDEMPIEIKSVDKTAKTIIVDQDIADTEVGKTKEIKDYRVLPEIAEQKK